MSLYNYTFLLVNRSIELYRSAIDSLSWPYVTEITFTNTTDQAIMHISNVLLCSPFVWVVLTLLLYSIIILHIIDRRMQLENPDNVQIMDWAVQKQVQSVKVSLILINSLRLNVS